MRVGYAIGPPHLTAAFDKVRPDSDLTSLGDILDEATK